MYGGKVGVCQQGLSKEAKKWFLSALRVESYKSAHYGVATASRQLSHPSICLSACKYGRNYVRIFAKFDILCVSTHLDLSKMRQV